MPNFEKQKLELTPEDGFNLVGIDYFSDPEGKLYFIEHFQLYQDALKTKQDKKNPDEYLILYKGPQGECLCR